jgi:predicted nucleic acid-binding protein
MTYWDSAAILKVYVKEPDSDVFEHLLARCDGPIQVSAIAWVEILCALHRKARVGDLRPDQADSALDKYRSDSAAGRILHMGCGDDVVAEAGRIMALNFRQERSILIRSLDLIHLATAIAGRAEALVTTDARLGRLASLARLRVLP